MQKVMRLGSLVVLFALAIVGCGDDADEGAAGAGGGPPAAGEGGVPAEGPVRFAVIGDFGDDTLDALGLGGEAKVAALVAGWAPHFVVTTGDNNYPEGAAATIDANVGKHYQAFIGDYGGSYGPGSTRNRFWPTPGNHDWKTEGLAPYLDYFTLPGNERYYDVDFGLVHLFSIDSDGSEPDGTDAASPQAEHFQQAIEGSSACFRIVTLHHPPYSSGIKHGSNEGMRWPFAAWGVDAVMAGHEHNYERLEAEGVHYFVNGLGGSLRYSLGEPLPEQKAGYDEEFGAMLVTATTSGIRYEFFEIGGSLVDSHEVEKSCP